MSGMRSIVNSSNLGDVVNALGRLSAEDAERIGLPWLQTGLRVTSRDRTATCRFGPTLATYTDLETRQTTLSPLPLKDGSWSNAGYGRDNGHLIVLGFMFHEAGHLRYSDATNQAVLDTYGSSKYKTTALMLSNLLDDERLERWFKMQYPGTIAALDASRRYMAGSYNPTGYTGKGGGATNPHPKTPQYPRSITDKGDIRSIVTLGIAYDDFVSKPSTYFRDVRRCYMAVRLIVRMGLGEGPDISEATVVATHLKQVAALIRLVNRYGKGLPEPEPKPEPQTTESGDEGDEGEEGEPGPAWGDDDDDSDGEDNGSGSDESDESESDDGEGNEPSDAGDEVDEGSEGQSGDDGSESDEDGEAEQSGDEGDSDDGSESESESDEGEGEGKGTNEGGDDGWADIHAPGGQGAGAGKVDLDKLTEDLNERLDKATNDPFVHDKDIMTDGTLTGTIERNPTALGGGWEREVGDGDPYLTDVMRESFLSTRFSHESYSTGYTRGRLRTRDACKAPAGVANLFSQRSDASVTRARLTIMLDYSGSMSGSLMKQSDTFFRSLADATTHIGAIRISAWTYESNDLAALWESNEGEHVLEERLTKRYAGGGTGTAACLGMLVDEVERTALPGERQVILSVTDGAPNEGSAAVRTVVEDAREAGISVLGVNIGNSNPDPKYVAMFERLTAEQYGDDAVTWNAGPEAWSDLGDEVLTMVGEVLAGARTF